jgi:hypothetical protein
MNSFCKDNCEGKNRGLNGLHYKHWVYIIWMNRIMPVYAYLMASIFITTLYYGCNDFKLFISIETMRSVCRYNDPLS